MHGRDRVRLAVGVAYAFGLPSASPTLVTAHTHTQRVTAPARTGGTTLDVRRAALGTRLA